MNLEDFVRDLTTATTPEEAYRILTRTVAAFGFHACDYGAGNLRTTQPRTTADIDFICYFSSSGSADAYLREGFAELDPFGKSALARHTPITYGEILKPAYEEPQLREMLEAMRGNEINEGLLFPIHSPGLRFAGVCMGTSLAGETFAALDRKVRPLLTAVAYQFHEHVAPMLWPADPAAALSIRERECLLWTARGKTTWETARILNVSETTAKSHLESAMRKLKVASRTHAVAEAVRRGLIRLDPPEPQRSVRVI